MRRAQDVALTNPGLSHLSDAEIGALASFLGQFPPGIVMRTPTIRSATGAKVRGYLITVPLLRSITLSIVESVPSARTV